MGCGSNRWRDGIFRVTKDRPLRNSSHLRPAQAPLHCQPHVTCHAGECQFNVTGASSSRGTGLWLLKGTCMSSATESSELGCWVAASETIEANALTLSANTSVKKQQPNNHKPTCIAICMAVLHDFAIPPSNIRPASATAPLRARTASCASRSASCTESCTAAASLAYAA